MTRNIDFSKPLSADEQAYVADRPWLLEDARLRGEEVTFDDDFTVEDDSTDPDTTPAGAPAIPVVDRPNDDPDNLAGDDETEDEDGDDSAEGDDDTDESEDGADDEDEVAPYEEWDYQDLKDEAKSRDLSAGGSKEQLIKRLQDHDASAQE